ncbi:MAG: nicotinamide-nucleotide amidase [Desulforhopalus sp.]|jgi:nicotinamide-nucleotide amidase
MKSAANVEVLIIGNEILTGDILDTNTNWLCRLVHGRGGCVTRVTIVPDVLKVVSQAIRDAVARKVDILFTSGGLGPTSDDLTLQAVADGTDRKVVLHEVALEQVRQQYDHFFEQGIMTQGGLNPARQKMACLPLGGEPLLNPVGTAPGVFLQVEKTAIICVPGVPSELKGIIEQSLQPFLDQVFGEGEAMSRCVAVTCNDESLLEPVLIRIVEDYPDIYTKSLATTIGENPEMDIIMTISGIGEKLSILEKAFDELCAGIVDLGFSITRKSI